MQGSIRAWTRRRTIPFCRDAGWICDDFDHPAPGWPTPPWDSRVVGDGGSLGIVDAGCGASPGCAELSIDAGAGPSNVLLTRGIVANMGGFHCAFAISVPERGAGGVYAFKVTASSFGNQQVYVGGIIVHQSFTTYYEGTNSTNIAFPLSSQWYEFDWQVGFATGTRLLINGTVQIDTTADASAPDAATSAVVSLGIGEGMTDPGSYRFLYDNVRCDALN